MGHFSDLFDEWGFFAPRRSDNRVIPEYPIFQAKIPSKKRFAKLRMIIDTAEAFDDERDSEIVRDVLIVLRAEVDRQIKSDADK